MADVDATLLAALLKESLQKGQHPRLTVTSRSMTPLLQPGDEIILELVTFEQLQPGDILTVKTENHLQTHRYWGSGEQGHLLTRGDQSLEFDKPWPVDDLIGRVHTRQRQDKVLSLRGGWGQWLNRQLTRLLTAEWRWLFPAPEQTSMIILFLRRLTHRLLRLAAKILTIFVDRTS